MTKATKVWAKYDWAKWLRRNGPHRVVIQVVVSALTTLQLTSNLVLAQVFTGPVSASLAGTGRAGLGSPESTFINPALIALLPDFDATAYYQDGYLDVATHQTSYGITFSDNSEDLFLAGAFSYVRRRFTGLMATPVDAEIWHASTGKTFFNRLSLGASIYHHSLSPEGDRRYKLWNGALGGLFLISDTLGVAYVFYNPVSTDSEVPLPLRPAPAQAIGTYYGVDGVGRFRADVVRAEKYNPQHKLQTSLSVEGSWNPNLLFRVGRKWDDWQRRNLLTLGLGFNGPKLKIDYSFEKNLHRTSGALHSVDMRMTF